LVCAFGREAEDHRDLSFVGRRVGVVVVVVTSEM
jgi:hypothetical protein